MMYCNFKENHTVNNPGENSYFKIQYIGRYQKSVSTYSIKLIM